MADTDSADGRERRQYERWQADEAIELIHDDVRYAATVVNASAGGLAVRAELSVQSGDVVHVTMRGLPDAPLTVVRRSGDIIALKFQDGPNYHFR